MLRAMHLQGRSPEHHGLEDPTEEDYKAELYAGSAGIRKGEEVTINYSGERPDESYFSSFGFLPEKPSKNITVFHMTPQLNDSLVSLELPLFYPPLPFSLEATAEGLEPDAEQFLLRVLMERLPGERQGFLSFGRELLASPPWVQKPTSPVHIKKLWELLLHRCRRMLDESEALASRDPPPADMSANMQLSVKLRERQLKILRKLVPVCIQNVDAFAEV